MEIQLKFIDVKNRERNFCALKYKIQARTLVRRGSNVLLHEFIHLVREQRYMSRFLRLLVILFIAVSLESAYWSICSWLLLF